MQQMLSSETHPAPRRRLAHLDAVAALVEPESRHGARRRILLVVERVGLAQDLDLLADAQRAAEDASECVEVLAVGLVVHLGHVDHEEPLGIAREHRRHARVLHRARVRILHL